MTEIQGMTIIIQLSAIAILLFLILVNNKK